MEIYPYFCRKRQKKKKRINETENGERKLEEKKNNENKNNVEKTWKKWTKIVGWVLGRFYHISTLGGLFNVNISIFINIFVSLSIYWLEEEVNTGRLHLSLKEFTW